MTVMLVLAAFAAGMWCEQRETAGKWPFYRNHKRRIR